MKRMTRRKGRRHTAIHDISMTPLIDVALTLLIIFMVATPMIQNGIKITLPHGQAQENKEIKQELVVEVDKAGKLFFNGKQFSAENLIQEIKKQVRSDQERTVFIKGDVEASYGRVFELVDQIKVIGGVQYVALASKPRTT
jgi:biopolymer transport protein TolR